MKTNIKTMTNKLFLLFMLLGVGLFQCTRSNIFDTWKMHIENTLEREASLEVLPPDSQQYREIENASLSQGTMKIQPGVTAVLTFDCQHDFTIKENSDVAPGTWTASGRCAEVPEPVRISTIAPDFRVEFANVNIDKLKVILNMDVAGGLPAGLEADFSITSNGNSIAVTAVSDGEAGDEIFTLTLASEVGIGDMVSLNYTANSDRVIKDASNNRLGSFSGQEVQNATGDETPPVFVSAEVNGNVVRIRVSENLATLPNFLVPDFFITSLDSGNPMITAVSDGQRAGDDVFELELDRGSYPGKIIKLAYSGNSITDQAQNPLRSFVNREVINNTADFDNDGLIEVHNLDMLNNIRHNLAGTSYKTSPADSGHTLGCPAAGCNGYELTRSLDFAQGGSYTSGNVNSAWRSGAGWLPIGDCGVDTICDNADDTPFAAVFEGNGNTISNLFINRSSNHRIGLFGLIASGSEIRNLGLVNLEVTGRSVVGGLVGLNSGGTITASYATGNVEGAGTAEGGLVGWNDNGTITASYAMGRVTGITDVGGLVGRNFGGTITASYATGRVTGTGANVGGLVGRNDNGTITASYATGMVTGTTTLVGGLVGWNFGTITASYWDRQTSQRSTSAGGGTSLTTSQMKAISGSITGLGTARFQFTPASSYPKVKVCTTCTGVLVFSNELVGGQ